MSNEARGALANLEQQRQRLNEFRHAYIAVRPVKIIELGP